MQQEEKIKRLQDNLRFIRAIAGWTTADLGKLIGVSKQTISNLEMGKTNLGLLYYLAIRSVLEQELDEYPQNIALAEAVYILLDLEAEPGSAIFGQLKSVVSTVAAAAAGGEHGDKLNETFIRLTSSIDGYQQYLEQKYKLMK